MSYLLNKWNSNIALRTFKFSFPLNSLGKSTDNNKTQNRSNQDIGVDILNCYSF